MEGSRIRKEKVADLKISGYVWTGSSRQLFVANRGGISNRKLMGAALPDCHEKNIYIIINK